MFNSEHVAARNMFRKGRTLTKKYRSAVKTEDIFPCFVDFVKPFNKVQRVKILKNMENHDRVYYKEFVLETNR